MELLRSGRMPFTKGSSIHMFLRTLVPEVEHVSEEGEGETGDGGRQVA
jgi:hypothetical protein